MVAGHRGMVGSALVRALEASGVKDLLLVGRDELDFLDQAGTYRYLEEKRPDIVIVAAARVGGIGANASLPASFLQENLSIALNLIEGSRRAEVPRLMFLGSSCIYPRMAPQPIAEKSLLTSSLEPTNEAYAIAKIAGLKLCESYRKQLGLMYHSVMPANLYGPGDNYHPEHSHVLPALLRRAHEAAKAGDREMVVWGSGSPLREFLFVDDLAQACIFLLGVENPPDWVNIGSGQEVSIRTLAETITRVTGFKGQLVWDRSKPDGTPRKLLDSSLLSSLGWSAPTPLQEGLAITYRHFLRDLEAGRLRR